MSQSQLPKPIRANTPNEPITFTPNIPNHGPYYIPAKPLPRLIDHTTPPVESNSSSTPTSTIVNTSYAKSITITCRNKHCHSTTHDHNMHYLRIHNTVTHTNVQHCPMCPAPLSFIRTRPLDHSDMLCLTLTPMKRAFAEFCIQEYNNQLTATRTRTRHSDQNPTSSYTNTSVVNVPVKYKSVEDLILQNFPKIHTSTGVCPLHVQCNDCHASFSVLRTNPTVHQNPKYCIWCASSNITVTLPSTDDTASLVLNLDLIEQSTMHNLAVSYGIPPKFFEIIYDEWSRQNKIKTLKEWMELPSVQKIIAAVQAKHALP